MAAMFAVIEFMRCGIWVSKKPWWSVKNPVNGFARN
jgi:hypothetical protein